MADGGSPYFEAFVADVKLALREPGKSDSWAGKLIPVLERLGYEWPAQPGRPWEKFIRHQLVLPDILKAFERLLVADWARHEAGHADPRLSDGSGVTMCRYVNWMGLPVREGEDGVLDPGRYQGVYLPVSSFHAIARFRLCAWPLEVYRAAGVRVRSGLWCPSVSQRAGCTDAGRQAVRDQRRTWVFLLTHASALAEHPIMLMVWCRGHILCSCRRLVVVTRGRSPGACIARPWPLAWARDHHRARTAEFVDWPV